MNESCHVVQTLRSLSGCARCNLYANDTLVRSLVARFQKAAHLATRDNALVGAELTDVRDTHKYNTKVFLF